MNAESSRSRLKYVCRVCLRAIIVIVTATALMHYWIYPLELGRIRDAVTSTESCTCMRHVTWDLQLLDRASISPKLSVIWVQSSVTVHETSLSCCTTANTPTMHASTSSIENSGGKLTRTQTLKVIWILTLAVKITKNKISSAVTMWSAHAYCVVVTSVTMWPWPVLVLSLLWFWLERQPGVNFSRKELEKRKKLLP